MEIERRIPGSKNTPSPSRKVYNNDTAQQSPALGLRNKNRIPQRIYRKSAVMLGKDGNLVLCFLFTFYLAENAVHSSVLPAAGSFRHSTRGRPSTR